ncbi:hypothetical protein JCM15457_1791 [Liquorilactobacillus sucicola DSM 21376 = JCM 15457]|nr:DUF6287 domain-containing protein [Liquorilactobacillus sucicola]GAJ26840.1 hypothetical protein JCM15457_1791 [Liquorilactobacillus sucicola DSM 21376 = JCM 15457]
MANKKCRKSMLDYLSLSKHMAIAVTTIVVTANLAACSNSQSKQQSSNKTRVTSSKNKSSHKSSVKQKSNQESDNAANSQTSSKNNVSESASKAESTTKQMDFSQIQQGNYASLLGNWQEVAISGNHHDGTGSRWEESQGTDTLEITKDKLANGSLTLQGNSLNDGTARPVTFTQKDGYLNANLADQSVAVNYAIYFYPKGIAMSGFGDDVPASIDNSKNRIVIWTSNNSYTEVFQSQDN